MRSGLNVTKVHRHSLECALLVEHGNGHVLTCVTRGGGLHHYTFHVAGVGNSLDLVLNLLLQRGLELLLVALVVAHDRLQRGSGRQIHVPRCTGNFQLQLTGLDVTLEHRVDVLGIFTHQRFWVAAVRVTVLLLHSSARFLALRGGITKETEPVAGTARVHHLVRWVTLDIAVAPTGLVTCLAAQVIQNSVAGVTRVLCNSFLHHPLPLRRDLRQQCHLT